MVDAGTPRKSKVCCLDYNVFEFNIFSLSELVEFSNERCDKYGHDQIQFNNALSRSALAWNELPEKLDSGTFQTPSKLASKVN